jgi:8-oxo-dGTP pyrophosphatase MutT (NUDIX family)
MGETTCGIYLFNATNRKLLVCHATHASWKQWSIPKGLKESNETAWDAAIRELQEETGIELGQLNVRAAYPLPSAKYVKQNKLLESFLVIIDDPEINVRVENRKGKISEVDSWKWISLVQARTWLHESQQKNLPRIEKLVDEHYHHANV